MQVDRQHHLLRRNMQLVRRSIDDSLVGLVRNEPVDIVGRGAGGLEGVDDHVGDHADGVLEHFAAFHPQIAHGPGRGRTAIDV